MEMPEWLTNAIIVLVVIFVIGAIIYLIAPDTYKDIFKIAEETFQIGEEKKRAEAAEEIMGTTIDAFQACIENAVDSCSCRLDASKLPNGYIIWLKNIKNAAGEKSVAMQAFSSEGAAIGNMRTINNINVRIAVPGEARHKDGTQAKGIMCVDQDMRIKNENGKIRIGAETATGGVKWLDFYNEGISQQIFKSGNSACFLTTEIESGIKSMGEVPEWADNFNFISGFGGTDEEWKDDTKRSRLLVHQLASLPFCKGEEEGTSFGIIWPVEPGKINSIENCRDADTFDEGRLLAESNAPETNAEPGTRIESRIHMSVEEDAEILVPVAKGVITNYCSENCGEEGKSITMHEIISKETRIATGRVFKITGMKEIKEGYTARGSLAEGKVKNGKDVAQKEAIGTSGGKVIFSESFEAYAGNLFPAACTSPESSDESSSGTSRDPIVSERAARGYARYVREASSRARAVVERFQIECPESGESLFYPGMESLGGNIGQRFIKARFCSLPRLSADKYSGEGCREVISAFQTGCIAPGAERGTVPELMSRISSLQSGQSGSMTLNFDVGGSQYAYVAAFSRDQREIGDWWWDCPGTGWDGERGSLGAPSYCGPGGCICLCMSTDACNGPCWDFNPLGFVPKLMKGGECEHGIFFSTEGSSRFRKVAYQRVGDVLGLCTGAPCI